MTDRRLELDQLHYQLEGIQAEPPEAWSLFHDTQCLPTSSTQPAGPADPRERTLWLSKPEAKHWTPDERQMFARHQERITNLPINKALREATAAALATL